MIKTDFGELIAGRVRVEHRVLAARWFARLLDLLPVEARDVFPTESLLDHVPALILEIGSYLSQSSENAIAANTAILDKARELGALRHAQKASLHQLLREYQILNSVLVAFVIEEVEAGGLTPPAAQMASLVSRLNEAVNVLSQSTVEAFVTLYTETISEQNERLEQFTRMAAHEWRQPLGALQFGVSLLRQPNVDADRAQRALAAIDRSVQHLVSLTHRLETIARIQETPDNPVVQQIMLTTIAQDAARQLREMAEARGVTLHIQSDMPQLVVDVGRLELVLVNLLSNAIKYSDASKPIRRVDITGGVDADGQCRVEIHDNGVGIPEHALKTIFHRFTRAHTQDGELSHIGGMGLGLSITEDCVRELGGEVQVRSTEGEGTTFVVTLPGTVASGTQSKNP